jgi:hypothetical protein
VDLVIEFLEYHVGHKGVAHVHLGVDYKWGSEDMDTLLKVTHPPPPLPPHVNVPLVVYVWKPDFYTRPHALFVSVCLTGVGGAELHRRRQGVGVLL